jgi:hypothetical protein
MPANSNAVGAKKAWKMSKKQRRRNEDSAGPICTDRLGRKESKEH